VADTTYRPPDGYLTLGQTEERLGISRATVRRIVASGRLDTFEDPRNRRVRLVKVEDVERLARPVPSEKACANSPE
jgi:hypothetical protein